MINFFKNIRRKLANENKFQRYLRYAIGEVLLIMLGIFMALQLQNWNEKRKQETQFRTTLDQLYTNITFESQFFVEDSMWSERHITWIDQLLINPDSVTDIQLPIRLYWISKHWGSTLSSEISYFSQHLIYDPNDEEQVILSKEILTYINNITNRQYDTDDRLMNILNDIDISVPVVDFVMQDDFENQSDSLYYDDSDIQNLRTLIRSRKVRALLKTIKTYKRRNLSKAVNYYEDSQSIKNLIKSYYPNVKLLYKDVGIIGSAINGWNKSTPMIFNIKENIWEIDLYLKAGEIKFRCRDSWAQNWGSNKPTFPNGIGYQEGGNIHIPEAGSYHVIFKPETGEYQFIKQDD